VSLPQKPPEDAPRALNSDRGPLSSECGHLIWTRLAGCRREFRPHLGGDLHVGVGGVEVGKWLSIRGFAEGHRVHRRTVRQALASAVPPPRWQYPARPHPAIVPYTAIIDGWPDRRLGRAEEAAQTARRIWQRLVGEHGARYSEMTVSRCVAPAANRIGDQAD
jgi:hypothetical protein